MRQKGGPGHWSKLDSKDSEAAVALMVVYLYSYKMLRNTCKGPRSLSASLTCDSTESTQSPLSNALNIAFYPESTGTSTW